MNSKVKRQYAPYILARKIHFKAKFAQFFKALLHVNLTNSAFLDRYFQELVPDINSHPSLMILIKFWDPHAI